MATVDDGPLFSPMSIITVPRAKTLLGITDESKDDAILALIGVVRDDVVALTNNAFADLAVPAFRVRRAGDEPLFWIPDPSASRANAIWLASSTLTFSVGDPPTITDSNSQWLVANFAAGLDVLVWGSLYNDGFYTVSTDTAPTAGVLALLGASEAGQGQPADVLTAEASSEAVRVFRVQWGGQQRSLELVVSEMLAFHLTKQSQFAAESGELAGLRSERLGDYQATFAAASESGASVAYPASILSRLDARRIPVFY